MALRNLAGFLKKLPVLRELDDEALRFLAFSVREQELEAGEVLFREGDASEGGYVVLGGSIVLSDSSGHDPLRVGPGGVIGETSLITAVDFQATAIAAEFSQVIFIERQTFRRLLEEFPDSAVRLHQSLTNRMLSLTGEVLKLKKKFI